MSELLATRPDVSRENLLKEINFLAHSPGVDAWIRDRLQKMHRASRQTMEENERLKRQVSDLSPFLAAWASKYQEDHKLDGLHPVHYDMLKEAGARMDGFQRATTD